MHVRLDGSKPLAALATASDDAVDLTSLGESGLVIDARGLAFASPMDLTALVASAHVAYALGPVTLRVPADPSVAAYLQRMDVARRLPPTTRIDGSFPS
jgi:hypothetical protein